MVEEAERALSLTESGAEDGEEIDRDKERLESVKAASISALVGTFSGLPICFIHVTDTTQLLLPLAINFISCALFGITFRYTIRRNLDDVQLKTGVAAAFGVVKGNHITILMLNKLEFCQYINLDNIVCCHLLFFCGLE